MLKLKGAVWVGDVCLVAVSKNKIFKCPSLVIGGKRHLFLQTTRRVNVQERNS